MSAYNTLKTSYKDKECLVAALSEQGYKNVEVHEQPQTLIDYHGSPRPQKANVIVRRVYIGAAANDLGFVRTADGTYSAIVSDYDSHRHNPGWFDSLKKHYSEKVIVKTAEKNGLKFLGKKIIQGKVQLQWLDTRQ